jgi:hypothetical protein
MVEKMPPPAIEYLNWSGQDIGFTIVDHPQQVPRPRQSVLILPAVIAGFDVSRVFIDGCSSLNLMYADKLRKMNISLANLTPTDMRFHGITPDKPSYPLGKINLDVQFGTRENYMIEMLEFEVVDFPSQYHALLGRPAYARFMEVSHYTYLLWRLPGPRGPITVKGSFALADNCDKDFHRLSETFGMQAEYMESRLTTDYDVYYRHELNLPASTFSICRKSFYFFIDVYFHALYFIALSILKNLLFIFTIFHFNPFNRLRLVTPWVR